MDFLYAPWRFTYHETQDKIDGCVFCHISKNPTLDENLEVIFRDEYVFVVMNKYPYSPGHIMVIPHIHIDNIEELDEDTWLQMSKRVKQASSLLKDVIKAEGINIGMNLGRAAGAGIAEHIHYHLVPRWIGDTNFITVVANSRVYPTDFHKIFKELKEKSSKYFK